MNAANLLTSNVLSRVTSVSITDMLLTVVMSFLMGLFIFYVYKRTFRGVVYSSGFGLTLIGLCMVAAMLILAVSSNIMLSLGVVGALSIVRFRTAIKEPLDIVFLFWAIVTGIIVAVGLYPLAVFGSVGIGFALLTMANRSAKTLPYILVVNCADGAAEDAVMEAVRAATARQVLKGKTFSATGAEEITLEVQLKNGESSFVRTLSNLPGVQNVAMVSYNGDYMN